MAATAPTAPPPATAPGAGPSADEKAAATGAVALGFALGGPVGGVVMALAVGIEQAFAKSGWNQPGWLGGDRPPAMTPEEIRQRHDEAVRLAQEYITGARQRAKERDEALKQHRDAMRDWVNNGRSGDKPQRPESRGAGEFLGDFFATSKSWYTLFDDKMTKGNEKITGTYPAIADFFRRLYGFVTGFGEGVKAGWQQYQDEKNQQDLPDEPIPTPELDPADESTRELDPAGGTPEPAPEPPDPPPLPPPPATPVGEPAAVDGPGDSQGELNPGPAGAGEGTVEGELMGAEDTAALPSAGAVPHMGPQGETNLDLLYQAFAPAAPVLASITEQVGTLQPLSTAVRLRVARIAALCGVAGAPAPVYQMMDEARLLTRVVDDGLVEIGMYNETARELTDEALLGLLPAQDDLETTRSEHASGDLYNRAGH